MLPRLHRQGGWWAPVQQEADGQWRRHLVRWNSGCGVAAALASAARAGSREASSICLLPGPTFAAGCCAAGAWPLPLLVCDLSCALAPTPLCRYCERCAAACEPEFRYNLSLTVRPLISGGVGMQSARGLGEWPLRGAQSSHACPPASPTPTPTPAPTPAPLNPCRCRTTPARRGPQPSRRRASTSWAAAQVRKAGWADCRRCRAALRCTVAGGAEHRSLHWLRHAPTLAPRPHPPQHPTTHPTLLLMCCSGRGEEHARDDGRGRVQQLHAGGWVEGWRCRRGPAVESRCGPHRLILLHRFLSPSLPLQTKTPQHPLPQT